MNEDTIKINSIFDVIDTLSPRPEWKFQPGDIGGLYLIKDDSDRDAAQ